MMRKGLEGVRVVSSPTLKMSCIQGRGSFLDALLRSAPRLGQALSRAMARNKGGCIMGSTGIMGIMGSMGSLCRVGCVSGMGGMGSKGIRSMGSKGIHSKGACSVGA